MRLEVSFTGGKKTCLNIISLIIPAIVLYYTYTLFQLRYLSTNEVTELQDKLRRVVFQLTTLEKKHSSIVRRLKDFPEDDLGSSLLRKLLVLRFKNQEPLEEYENIRQRIYSNTKELWYYINYQFMNLISTGLSEGRRQEILKEIARRKRWLLSDQEKLLTLDGHEEWRRREAANVSELVQRKLDYIQNPPDCHTAKKLVCKHDVYGYGCNLHHAAYCLTMALAYERTLVFSHVRKNQPMHNWNKFFHPVSDTCTAYYTRKKVCVLSDKSVNDSIVYVPFLRSYDGIPIKSHYIPKSLATRIARFNSDPYSWWIGQMLKFLLKLQRPYIINDTIALIRFKSPIVGVQVRRTDKLWCEAKYVALDEYMYQVQDYYDQLELTQTVDERRVYLATDDVDVLKEAIKRYPQYTFYGDFYRTKMASVASRTTSYGFSGFLLDIHLLSLCDFVVCTFSSNVGRLIYELMQTRRIDATNRVTTVDSVYHFKLGEQRYRTAVMRNKDVPFEIGDLIEHLQKQHTIRGTVLSTNKVGIIPRYKTEEYIIQYP